tara:strand:+ start:172 stop:1266 length:1095 start_codon:yes stop_codon:yes gene_type:complete
MNDKYIIVDNRLPSDLKVKTFSGFKKNDVFRVLLDSIEKGQIENSCHWCTECIVSGYFCELLDKLISFSCKIIHLNSPNLPQYLSKKYNHFYRIVEIDLKKKKELEMIIHYRNNQCIRNLFFDLVVTLTSSHKTRRFDKYPKINEKTDFLYENIQKRLVATANFVPDNMIKFTDPDEVKIIINEILFHYKNKASGYEIISYWISWVIQWEKVLKKQKKKWEIEPREIKGVKPCHCKDILWLIWHTILHEAREYPENIQLQIHHLYYLYKSHYGPSKRTLRIPLIYLSVAYLSHQKIDFTVPIKTNVSLFIQTQAQVNFMFYLKKQNEINNFVHKEKEKKKITSVNEEKSNDVFNIINDIQTVKQ